VLALPNTIQVYFVIIFVGVVINLALGIYLIRLDPRSTVNKLGAIIQALLSIWAATGLAALVLETNQVTSTTFTALRINAMINYLSASFMGCTWLHLALLFPHRHPVTRQRWLYPLLYGPNALFYILRLTNPWHGLFYRFSLSQGQFVSARGPLFLGLVTLSYSQVALAIVLLIRAACRLDNVLQRKQAAILTGATLLVVTGHIVRVISPHLLAADPSLLLLTFSGILYTYGVLRYRLLGLSVILNRAVIYGLTWIVLAATVFVGLSLLPPIWHRLSNWELTLIALFFFGLCSMARSRLENLVERSLNRGHQAHQQAVQEFMAQLTSVTGSDQLLPGIVEFIVETMYAENGAIIVQDQVTGDYILRYSRGLGDLTELKYSPHDPFFVYLRGLEQGHVLEWAQVLTHPRYYEIRDVAEERLRRWRAKVCLTLKVQDELVGVMTLGPRPGRRSYRRSDIRLFSQVAQQMAISVYNVLYYDAIVAAQCQLASLNEELERRVQERTQRLEERTRELAGANKELSQIQQQIIQSEKMAAIGELAAGVAHEINNPVGVILGFSQLLQRRIPSDDRFARPLATIERESLRCKQIVQNLLDFARTSAPQLLEVDLHQTLEATCQLLEYQLSRGKVQLVKNYATNLPAIVIDPQQIQQVFVNLMLNAYQAMPQGGHLEIKTWRQEDKVAVAFSDEGIGIPRENLGRIFDPFFTTKEPDKGTGLGLSVSYGIVQRHSGYIEVESQMNKGTTFTVHLPITQDRMTFSPQPAISAPESPQA
jgi:signal transduction histidine kinase